MTAEDIVVQITVKDPDKTTYKVGESLDKTGMELLVTYASGKKEIVTKGFTCSPTQLPGKGTQPITVIYKGEQTVFYVTVTE